MRRRRVPEVISAVLSDGLTYLGSEALLDLYTAIRKLERRRAEGILIEAGCARGGSALVLASAKARTRPFFIYDVFGMIPPPSEKDGADVHERYRIIRTGQSKGIGGGKYYGYEEDLYDKQYVQAHTEDFEQLREHVRDYAPEKMAEICGVDAELLRHIARTSPVTPSPPPTSRGSRPTACASA